MQKTFFSRHALLILMAVFFLVPFALRGARLSMQHMTNDVKDWLPAEFQETAEMDWFWQHFLGERFIVISWEGCREGDPALMLFTEKLHPAVPPSQQASNEPVDGERQLGAPAGEAPVARGLHSRNLERAPGFIGDRLGLFSPENEHFNWGGRQEKWLQDKNERWYFITPSGELYRWHSLNAPLVSMLSRLWTLASGATVAGEEVASFGELDGPWYYENPQRLNAQLVKSITTGPDVLEHLTRDGGVLEDNPEEAAERLEGVLYGPDGEQTCMVLTLTEEGIRDFHRVIGRGVVGKPRGRVLQVAEECGIDAEALRMGGPPVDNVAIDEEGTVTLLRLVSISTLLGLGLAYVCLRSIKATIIVFFVGGISAVASLAVVGWSGVTVDAIMMSMPSLVYVLGISGAVHLINYYREAVHETGLVGAPEKALKYGWKPAVLCSATTAMGLASLYTSEIAPIRKFGVYSALAVLGTLILLFTYLPAAMQLWPIVPRSTRKNEPQAPTPFELLMNRFWDRFGGGIIRRHYIVAPLCIVFIAVVGFGVTKITTTVNLLKLFDEDAKILRDYAWLEENVGKLVPMEVVIKFDDDALLPSVEQRADAKPDATQQLFQLSFLDRMDVVNHVQRVIEETFGESGQDIAGRSLSALTFAPELPSASGSTANFVRRNVTARQLEQHRDEFLASDYLRIDKQDGSELWRISLRLGAFQDIDYGQFVSELKQAVEPVLTAQQEREHILREIVKQRDGEPYTAARVVLLGAPLSRTADAEDETTDGGKHQTIDQTHIFADTLKDLLAVSRLRVDWHNPNRDAMPENVPAAIAPYDCVVLVADHPDYDLEVLRKHARLLVDARPHLQLPAASTGISILPTSQAAAADPVAGREASNRDVVAVYTGVVPIVYKAQRTLLNSLIESTFWSFVTITPLMMFLSWSISAGLVAMLPNVLPVFVIFGSMGWLGIDVDIGSMMTASIALGVAVDDTIHYLTWFRSALDECSDRKRAILMAYKHCATPTLQAAIISGMGLSVFAFSTFAPTQRFGYLMLTILFAGVVAELIFFPALLAGPLGRVFKVRKRAEPIAADESPEDAFDVPIIAKLESGGAAQLHSAVQEGSIPTRRSRRRSV